VAIYRVGQAISMQMNIEMRVLRAFAVEDTIYYIVWIPRSHKITNQEKTPLYGVFRHDDTVGVIPEGVNQVAENIIKKENLLEGLES
jgi:hypothetical protein